MWVGSQIKTGFRKKYKDSDKTWVWDEYLRVSNAKQGVSNEKSYGFSEMASGFSKKNGLR